MSMDISSLRSDLAPTGALRVGINYGNPVLAKRDPATGELSGVAVDLARELGRRVELPVELVGFDAAGRMFEAVKTGGWDVAFLAIDPQRANEIDFTAAYILIEGTYLVPAGSEFHTNEDIDREGVRIGVSANSAYDLFLSRNIKHAQLVRGSGPESAFDLILAGKVDVVAGVRQSLMANSVKLPGSRIFAGRFMAIEQALGMPRGHPAGAQYLREFIADVKASGFVARAIERSGVGGVSVAPPTAIRP
jgi:polar amino acid transport system substrate-binding protein